MFENDYGKSTKLYFLEGKNTCKRSTNHSNATQGMLFKTILNEFGY
jgi:hypothetical protein